MTLDQKINRHVSRYVGISYLDLDDLRQEFLIGLWLGVLRCGGEIDGNEGIIWNYGKRHVIDALRMACRNGRKEKRYRVSFFNIDDLLGVMSCKKISPEEFCIHLEKRMKLRSLLLHFGRRDREVMELYLYHNNTMKEIARKYGLTESRVCQIINNITEELTGRIES